MTSRTEITTETKAESQHTPGPWHLDPRDLLSSSPGYGIQSAHGWNVAVAIQGVDDPDQSLANARLISAAPELLRAAQNMMRQVNDPRGEWDAIRIAGEWLTREIGKATDK